MRNTLVLVIFVVPLALLGAQPPIRSDIEGVPLPTEVAVRLGSTRLRHADEITGVAFAPDGKTFASSSLDGSVRVWEVHTGKLRQRFDRASSRFEAVAFAPDGRTLVAVNYPRPDQKRIDLIRYDIAAAKPVSQATVTIKSTYLPGIALSPDGTRLAVSELFERPRLYDTGTGQEIVVFEKEWATGWSIAFSPDGKRVAQSYGGASVRLFDTTTGKMTVEVKTGQSISAFTFSADGRQLVTTSDRDDPETAAIWDLVDNKLIRKWESLQAKCAAAAPNGKMIATAGADGVWLHDLTKDKRTQVARETVYPERLRFSPDGNVLVAAGYASNQIVLWDVPGERKHAASSQPDGTVDSLAFADDGRTLLAASNSLSAWDVNEAKAKAIPPKLQLPGREAEYFSRDARLCIVGAKNNEASTTLIEVESGKIRLKLRKNDFAYLLAFAADGRTIATMDTSGRAHVWDTTTGKTLLRLPARQPAGAMALSPDSTLAAAVVLDDITGGSKTLRVWDLATGRLRFSRPTGSTNDIAFLPSPLRLIELNFRYEDNIPKASATISDPTSGRQLKQSVIDKVSLYWPLASPDGRSFITSGSKGVRLYESETLGLRHEFPHAGVVRGTAFHPSGALVAASSSDAPIYLWDVYGTKTKTPQELNAAALAMAWSELASADAAAAFRAIRRLVGSPSAAVAMLRERLKPSTETLRAIRAVEVLEAIGSDEAVKVLNGLAAGPAEDRLTFEGKATLGRKTK